MNYWVFVYRFAWFVLVILCAIGLTCIFLPKCQTYQELQGKKAVLEEENRQIEANIKRAQTQQELLQRDRAFVERTAREQGMAKPGETVFRVTREPAAPVAVHNAAPPPAPRKRK
jgi:cell division protein FtsB